MQRDRLTLEQKRLLERHHDGHGLAPGEAVTLQTLLAESEQARRFQASLDEVRLAVQSSEAVRWGEVEARVPTGEEVAQSAEDAQSLMDVPLEALWGMLQRYHDGEAIEQECAEVEVLCGRREDVAAYLEGLEVLTQGVVLPAQEHVESVDFSGFWAGIESRLEGASSAGVMVLPKEKTTTEQPAFEAEDHQVLLYRYFDQETNAQERAKAAAWVEVDPEIAGLLGALEEIQLAVNVAVEHAQERVDLSALWAGVEAGLTPASVQERPIDLGAARARKKGFFLDHSRELIAAFAAAICTVVGVGLFADTFFEPGERVIVEKHVVIVDSLEYGAGAAVVVTGAMQQASMELEPEAQGGGDQATVKGEDRNAEKASPVIWLIDEDAKEGATPSEESPEEEGSTKTRRDPI